MEQITITQEEYGRISDYLPRHEGKGYTKIQAVFMTQTRITTASIHIRMVERTEELVISEEEARKLLPSEYSTKKVENDKGELETAYVSRKGAQLKITSQVRAHLQRVFFPDQFAPELSNIIFAKPADIVLPPAKSLPDYIGMFSFLEGSPQYMTTTPGGTKTFCIMSYIFPMMAIDGMVSAYDVYTELMDQGVKCCEPEETLAIYAKILDNLKIKTETTAGVFRPTAPEEKRMTRPEWLALAYTHLFSWCKTRSAGTRNFELALKKRLSTLRNVMGWRYFSEDDFIRDRLDFEALSESCQFFSFFPVLKSVVLSNLINLPGNFSIHLKMILKESQITVFNFVHTFLYDSPLTALHFNKDVTAELDTYIEIFEMIKSKYGQNWHYMKLVNPNEQLSAINRFPHLANAARAYVLAHAPQLKTMRQIVGMKQVPLLYVKQARIPVEKDFYNEKENMDLPGAIEIYNTRLSKNINKDKLTMEEFAKMMDNANKVNLESDLIEFFKS